MQKHWIITAVLVVVIGAGAFFGGMQYQKTQRANAFGNFAQGGRRFIGGQFGANGNVKPVRGEIISNDGNSITVKLQDGSSKIVILSSSTSINEATSAGKDALTTGKQVMVFGSQNSDGSLTAQNIQLNPQQMMMMRGGGTGTPAPTK